MKIIFFDNNFIELDTHNTDLFYKIKKHYTFNINKFAIKNSKYTWNRNQHPSICLIKKNKFLPVGLLEDLIDFLTQNNEPFQISENLLKKVNITEDKLFKFINKLKLPFDPHDHQINAVLNAVKNKRITLKSATSSGKSLIIYILCMIYKTIKKEDNKILLIVPNVQLVGQMFEDFCEYSENNDKINTYNFVKMFHGNTDKIFNKEVLISTYQTLINQPPEFFEQFRYVIVDECHTAKSKSIIIIMNQCINADHRIGMTGSLFGTKNSESILNDKTIIGLLGPIYDVIDAKELIKKKLASPVNIKLEIINWGRQQNNDDIDNEIELIKNNKYMSDLDKRKRIKTISESLYRKERITIYQNEKRFNILYNLIEKTIDKNALIVFNDVDYGKKLHEDLNKLLKNKQIFHVDGGVKINDRDNLKGAMENTNNNIGVVSMGTFKQGISIKNLHYIIFAQIGKAQVSLIQLLGRGMRLHELKTEIIIIDIVDKLVYVDSKGNIRRKGYLQRHSEERIKIYKAEGHPCEIFNKHNLEKMEK